MNLLTIKNLSIRFHTDDAIVNAVDGISLTIDKAKTVCLVGESGCGKSVSALAIMRLIQCPPGEIAGGEIIFGGADLLTVTGGQIMRVRGKEIAMIFQDPMISLNPVFTCGFQIAEAIRQYTQLSKKEAFDRAVELLKQVHISDPHKRAREYPHQLSGGMRQRVMIAMALSCDPKLLIADEPTTALDVTVQAQILDLFAEIKQNRNMAMLFITHDLGIVAEIADEVIVLYAGKIAERGTAEDIFTKAKHPYTQGLLHSIPDVAMKHKQLQVIPGALPDPTAYTAQCRFYDRCPRHFEPCIKHPPEFTMSNSHSAACYLGEA
jgi:oligopeptide/dipeptide ABC transporter ATP-binding protein